MKKANVIQDGQIYKDRIIIENLNDLDEYFNTNFQNQVRVDAEYIICDELKTHAGTRTSSVCKQLQEVTGKGSLVWLYEIKNKTQFAMLKYVGIMGIPIMVNSAGGWCFVNKDAVVEYIKPLRYTEEDIHIKKWGGGRHYYAKVGTIDVVDCDGNVKWNSYDAAKLESIKMMRELNKSIEG